MQIELPSLQGEQRTLLSGVSWETFQLLLAELPHQRCTRLAYDNGLLEIMSPLDRHERIKTLLSDLVRVWSLEKAVPVENLGSWTMQRADLARAIEPDACFYVQNIAAVGEERLDLATTPPPDLVIEVDITSSSTARLSIYQALGVREVWRWSAQRLEVLHLIEGQYTAQRFSLVLSGFPVEQLTEMVLQSLRVGQDQVIRQFRQGLLS